MNLSIFGCGWLGLPLAFHLQKGPYTIHGSSTTETTLKTLSKNNINSYLLTVSNNGKLNTQPKTFFSSDCLIITLPFKRSLTDPFIYLNQIKSIINAYNKNCKKSWVILLSSTSIYPLDNTTVNEFTSITPQNKRQESLLATEQYVQKNTHSSAILRCGGLFGYKRKIGNFFTKKELSTPNAPVNLIHQTDVIGLIQSILQTKKDHYIFNAVCPHHPTKKELYTFHATLQNTAPPIIKESNIQNSKIVCSNYTCETLSYSFTYKNLLQNMND